MVLCASSLYSPSHHVALFLEKKADDAACPTESLPAGKHSFPFKVTLPKDIPYSYQTPRGNIRYTLNATIHVPPTTLPLTIAPSAPLLNSTEYNEVQFLTASRGITVCQELILAMFPRYAVGEITEACKIRVELCSLSGTYLNIGPLNTLIIRNITLHSFKKKDKQLFIPCIAVRTAGTVVPSIVDDLQEFFAIYRSL